MFKVGELLKFGNNSMDIIQVQKIIRAEHVSKTYYKGQHTFGNTMAITEQDVHRVANDKERYFWEVNSHYRQRGYKTWRTV